MKVLFLGFGDIARRTAGLFLASNWQVTGMRRSAASFPGVNMVAGDCRAPDQVAYLLPGHDLVVATLTPDSYTEEGYRRAYVASATALAAAVDRVDAPPPLIIWVSSTGVYGQSNGEWVDENSTTQPAGFSGRALLEAEQIVSASTCPSCIIRFSGIYGRGSGRQIDKVRRGECAPASPVKWTNRIHADDCAGVIHHLAQRHFSNRALEAIYIGTDCAPTPLHDVHAWLAQQLGVELRIGEVAGDRGNRRCDNARLLASGFSFRYPTFREGYTAFMAELGIKADVSGG